MEQADADSIFYRPTHPYTVGLLGAVPRLDHGERALVAIPGAPPNMAHLPAGCPFSERCTLVEPRCVSTRPALSAVTGRPNVLRACHQSAVAIEAYAQELSL
jgi:oligopeptide transport system ATP-binding protein